MAETGSSSPGVASNATSGPSVSIRIGGIGDHHAGHVRFGDRSAGSRIFGGISFRARHNRGHAVYYGGLYGDYGYHRYRPLYFGLYPYYGSGYGYSLTSIGANRYADPFYDVDVLGVGSAGAYTEIWDAQPYSDVTAEGRRRDVAVGEQIAVGLEPESFLAEGDAAFVAGRYDDARRHYAAAMLADEADGRAKLLYAMANLAVGDYELAAIALRRALLTSPQLATDPIDIRGLYPDVVQFESLVEGLVRFVDAHADMRGARLLLGYIEYASGRYERALSVFSSLADSDPDDIVVARLRDAVQAVIQSGQRDR